MFIRIKDAIFREDDIANIGAKAGDNPMVIVTTRSGEKYNVLCPTEKEAFEVIETVWNEVNPKNKKKGWSF